MNDDLPWFKNSTTAARADATLEDALQTAIDQSYAIAQQVQAIRRDERRLNADLAAMLLLRSTLESEVAQLTSNLGFSFASQVATSTGVLDFGENALRARLSEHDIRFYTDPVIVVEEQSGVLVRAYPRKQPSQLPSQYDVQGFWRDVGCGRAISLVLNTSLAWRRSESRPVDCTPVSQQGQTGLRLRWNGRAEPLLFSLAVIPAGPHIVLAPSPQQCVVGLADKVARKAGAPASANTAFVGFARDPSDATRLLPAFALQSSREVAVGITSPYDAQTAPTTGFPAVTWAAHVPPSTIPVWYADAPFLQQVSGIPVFGRRWGKSKWSRRTSAWRSACVGFPQFPVSNATRTHEMFLSAFDRLASTPTWRAG